MANGGYRWVSTITLRQYLAASGVRTPSDAARLTRARLAALPGGVVSAEEAERVRKLVTKWLAHDDGRVGLQARSLGTLAGLIGRTAADGLVGRPACGTTAPVTVLPDVSADVAGVLSPLRDTPGRLFDDSRYDARETVATLLGRFSRPFRHDGTVRVFGN